MSRQSHRLSSWRTIASVPQEAEALAHALFEQSCRSDTFDDLKRRAAFNRQDAGRLKHWIRAAHGILAERPAIRAMTSPEQSSGP